MSYWMYHLITNTKINILRFEEILRPCYDIIAICYQNHHKLSVSEKNSVPFSLFLLRNFNIVNLKLFLTLRWIMFLDMSLWNSVFKSCFWFWTLEEYCLIMIIIRNTGVHACLLVCVRPSQRWWSNSSETPEWVLFKHCRVVSHFN